MPFTYRVKAEGYGFGLATYDLDLLISSNYDIKKDRESVMAKIRNQLRKDWQQGYKIISVTKEKKNYLEVKT